MVDVRSHKYLLYKHEKLHKLFEKKCPNLPCDTIYPHDLFKYLRKMIVPLEYVNLKDKSTINQFSIEPPKRLHKRVGEIEMA